MIFVIMGVAGSGKTTVGTILANELHCPFIEGDDFHSVANCKKMSAGIPLTDDDRQGWLEQINEVLLTKNGTVVVACSALKDKYRRLLLQGFEDYTIVFLKSDKELLQERQHKRQGHFFSPSLLASQFRDLEEPKDALIVDARLPAKEIIEVIQKAMKKGEYSQEKEQ